MYERFPFIELIKFKYVTAVEDQDLQNAGLIPICPQIANLGGDVF